MILSALDVELVVELSIPEDSGGGGGAIPTFCGADMPLAARNDWNSEAVSVPSVP
jgi:hypothetical protein